MKKLGLKGAVILFVFAFCLMTGVCLREADAASAKLSMSNVTLDVKSSFTLTLNRANGNVTWKSSDTKIAKAAGSSNKAVVTAGTRTGTAVITAKDSKGTYKCKIKVVKMSLSSSKLRIPTYGTGSLTLKNADGLSVKFKSSDSSIVRIKSTAKNRASLGASGKTGTCTVTATLRNKKYVCKVTVYDDSVRGSWSGSRFYKSDGSLARSGVYKINGSNYVFDSNGNLVVNRWVPINGWWYHGDSRGQTVVNGWSNLKGPGGDGYWYNYSYYHGSRLYFDEKGRWDMRKCSRFSWNAVYRVVNKYRELPTGNKIQEGVYRLTPKAGKTGYYQWIMHDSDKYDDCRPIYAVKGTIYIQFGEPYSIQVKDLDFEFVRDQAEAAKAYTRHVIGWIGDTQVMYPQ